MRSTRTGACFSAFAAERPAKPPPTITTTGVFEAFTPRSLRNPRSHRIPSVPRDVAPFHVTNGGRRVSAATHRCMSRYTNPAGERPRAAADRANYGQSRSGVARRRVAYLLLTDTRSTSFFEKDHI